MGYKGRDVEVRVLENGLCLVGACDSCGGVGSKDLDLLKVPARLVGQLTARVALMEVLCTGARPQMMTVAISSEPDPTGREILEGVRREIGAAGFPGLPLVISTEKNFTPAQTGLGIGVTGTCRTAALRIAGSRPGDRVYCLGRPRVGEEVAAAPASEIIGTTHVRMLLNIKGIHDVVPVGSRGILAEAGGLASQARSEFERFPAVEPDMKKPAGPSTCVIFTADPAWVPGEKIPGPLPLFRIGRLNGPVPGN